MYCKIILPSQEIHKLQSLPKTFEEFFYKITHKLQDRIPEKFYFKYKDSDEELVMMLNEEDYQTAILTKEAERDKTLRLFVFEERIVNTNSSQSPPVKNNINRLLSLEGKTQEEQQLPKLNKVLSGSQSSNLQKPSQQYSPDSQSETLFDKIDLFSDVKELLQKTKFQQSGKKDEAKSVFTLDQIEIINHMIDSKLKERIEEKIQNQITSLLLKSFLDKSTLKTPNDQNTPSPSLPKSLPVSISKRNSVLTKPKSKDHDADAEITCHRCRKKIEETQYKCQTCENIAYCGTCESLNDHVHPLARLPVQGAVQMPTPPPIDKEIRTIPIKQIEEPVSNSQTSQKGYSINIIRPISQVTTPSNASVFTPISASVFPLSKKSSWDPPKPESEEQMVITPRGTLKESQYKGFLGKESISDVITVQAGSEYQIDFTVKNTGKNDWPDSVELICINGIHKGIKFPVGTRKSGNTKKDNSIVQVRLTAPEKPDRYLSQWTLQYTENDGSLKSFGGTIFIEINVTEDPNRPKNPTDAKKETTIKHLNIKNKQFGDVINPKKLLTSHSMSDKKVINSPRYEEKVYSTDRDTYEERLMKEFKCSKETIAQAKSVLEIYCTEDIKKIIRFILDSPISQNLNQLIDSFGRHIN